MVGTITNYFKHLYLYVPLRRPIYLIAVYFLLSKALNDLAYWISFFLRFESGEAYEKIVWNYSGPTKLFKELFKFRDSFIDVRYVFQKYWIAVAAIFIIWALIAFSSRVSAVLAPGKFRSWFERCSDFLWKPNKLVFFVFVFVYVYLANGFFSSIHHSFLLSVNQRLTRTMNAYAENLSNRELKGRKVNSNGKQSEPICTYRVHEKSAIFYIKYLDFMAQLFTGDDMGFKDLESKIKSLPRDLEVKIDESARNARLLGLEKETYTREDLNKILELDRKKREISIFKEMKNTPSSSLRIKFEGGKYLLHFYEGNGNQLFLGFVDFKCSRDTRELRIFEEEYLLNGLRFNL
ncbi:hypothetical protein DOM22_18920 [Bdellovibrio sp. ZAP7]|uniref:hypothetical protein n=1 Tax=Bdellovibrio sp. ZAP7 TaxID=2231053 RepID=UPI00116273FE|nr:hypothetical protein [Bdellovibrio sp. ZAP7]QDK47087.1 hypothetical protein DOM22_18920 [Bdellovibrio sp. ZAP7]